MVKRRRVISRKEVESRYNEKNCFHGVFSAKLSFLAAILFLITVWPALLEAILRVHWGWYLTAMIVFGLVTMRRFHVNYYCRR